MKENSLVSIGFTENQEKLYTLLLKKPGLSAGKIANELSLDRSFTYSIIESLVKRGLIYISINKKRKIFFPEKPKKILEDLEIQKDRARFIVENLNKIQKENNQTPNIEIYEGKQALKKYIALLLEEKIFLTLGGGGKLNIFNILKYEHPHYFNQLKREKISGKIICSHENKGFWKESLKKSQIEIKSLEGARKENSITILKDKVILSEETELPNVIIINNSNHAHSLTHYFNLLWKQAKP